MNQETKEKLTASVMAAKEKFASSAAWCKEKIEATWKSGRKGKAVCVGIAVAVLLLTMKCCGGGGGAGSSS